MHALSASCGFPGLDVVQFSDQDVRQSYVPIHHKVACSGTHDTQTLLGWAKSHFGEEGTPEFAERLLERVLATDAKVAIVPLQDVLGLDDTARMNVPGKADGNWCWQADAEDIKASLPHLKELAEKSGRAAK